MWKNKVKKWMQQHRSLTLVICTVITVIGLGTVFSLTVRGEQDIQKGIADEIIRFHVLGNSDSEEDQELKMMVKEQVIDYINPLLTNADSIEETRQIIEQELPGIQEKAAEVIAAAGYPYQATAELTNCYFPIKTYGDCTFPAGYYEALRICIGKAEGQNWWCVLYPNLCFIDSLHAIVPEEQKQELKNILTEEEYESIVVKSRLWEMLSQ